MALAAQTRWALVGPGAIGLYYGGLLIQHGVHLSVLARSDAAALSAAGIRLRMMQTEAIAAETPQLKTEVCARPNLITTEPKDIGPVDCVLIAAKSTVNPQLLSSLRPLVQPAHTSLLTLQNGMGNAEFLAQHFPENPILAGLCFVCVNRTAPGVVENFLPGRVEIGSLQDRWPQLVGDVVGTFNAAGISATASAQLDAALWRKLCWNIPFNGLSIAGGGLTTDRILKDPALRAQARRLMEEVRRVAAHAGYSISDAFIQGQFDVTDRMGAYQPSSLIDYLQGKPIEIESIWGEPLRRGQTMGLELPELERLYHAIQAMPARA